MVSGNTSWRDKPRSKLRTLHCGAVSTAVVADLVVVTTIHRPEAVVAILLPDRAGRTPIAAKKGGTKPTGRTRVVAKVAATVTLVDLGTRAFASSRISPTTRRANVSIARFQVRPTSLSANG